MGIHPPTMGAQHMRSEVSIPPSLKPYPQLLREKGYFTTNNAKTDYNVIVNMNELWDQNGNQAHWRNRQPGQPFFAVFNFEISHESQLRNQNTLAENRRHDPAKVPLPAYHPDAPEIRSDWAQSYDRILQLDDRIQIRLDELDEAGLAESTIVFFFGDHGSGMPRSKRTVLNTGMNTPLIIRIPEKFLHLAPPEYVAGGVSERLVSFVDFAPTLLSLIGEQAPATMHGKPFMGQYDAGPQPYIFGARDRMDERVDSSRSVRDERFVLALNLYPHIPFGAHVSYMFETPTTRVWRKLYDEGNLPPEQAFFFEWKPMFELYDLKNDPDQVRNLAYQPEYRETHIRLLTALLNHMSETRDLGFLPEAMMWERGQGTTLYELAHDRERYDIEAIMNFWLQQFGWPGWYFRNGEFRDETNEGNVAEGKLFEKINHPDDALRYWDAVNLLFNVAVYARMEGRNFSTVEIRQIFRGYHPYLKQIVADEQRIVRIPAAEALGRFGTEDDVARAADILFGIIEEGKENPTLYYYRTLLAFNSLDYFSERITDPNFADRVRAASTFPTPPPGRPSQTFDRIVRSVLEL